MNRFAMSTLTLALLVGATQAVAVTPTKNSVRDYRIKSVIYHADDTVELNVVLGLQIDIIVDPDEKYVTHAFGDEKAWQFAHTANHFFIRPTAELSDTNLTIVTDKRTYNLLLHFIGRDSTKLPDGTIQQALIVTPWAVSQATVELKYVFPDEAREKQVAEAAERDLMQAMRGTDPSVSRNVDYQMSRAPESASIAPINVWDDFHFTYFKFPANAELPTVFLISADGKESTVNTHIEGADHNIIVAETTAKEWRIRYGKKKVVGILNDDYDPKRGANTTGTTVPGFQRVLKNGDQP